MIELQDIHLLPKVRIVGAASGMVIDPPALAGEVGLKVNGAYLTSYMLRRFGPPNMPSDDYKEICSWLLKTGTPDVWLKVTPYLADTVERDDAYRCLSFAYLTTEALEGRCNGRTEENQAAFHAWTRRAAKWFFENARLAPIEDKDEVECVVDPWHPEDASGALTVTLIEPVGESVIYLKSKNPERSDNSSDTDLSSCGKFEDWVQYMSISGEFNQAYAALTEDCFSGWNPCPDSVKLVNDALRAALTDLKRPTYIRDVEITPSGCVTSDNPCDEGLELATPYEHAGIAMKSYFVPDQDSTWSI